MKPIAFALFSFVLTVMILGNSVQAREAPAYSLDTPCDCMVALGGFPVCPFPGNMNWEAFGDACVAFTLACAQVHEDAAACIASNHPYALCQQAAKSGYAHALRAFKTASAAACEQ